MLYKNIHWQIIKGTVSRDKVSYKWYRRQGLNQEKTFSVVSGVLIFWKIFSNCVAKGCPFASCRGSPLANVSEGYLIPYGNSSKSTHILQTEATGYRYSSSVLDPSFCFADPDPDPGGKTNTDPHTTRSVTLNWTIGTPWQANVFCWSWIVSLSFNIIKISFI
jgi:hypothetical protein